MTTTNKKPGKQDRADNAEALSAGATKHFPNASQSITLGNAPYTVADITQDLQEIATLRDAVNAARAATQAKIAAEKAQLPKLLVLMALFEAFVRATFGDSADVLADFGLAPKKVRTPSTTEEKVAAVAKGKATRKARNTLGPVAKLDVVGNVTGVVVTPVTAPTAATTTPAP
ncbi:MAG TPA: hypothetical protein VIY73_04875, partial [Polyangiaceae bacterium]